MKAENERLNQEIAEQKRKYIVEHSLKSGKEIRKAVFVASTERASGLYRKRAVDGDFLDSGYLV